MYKAPQPLVDMVRRVTASLGYEMVGVDLLSRDRGGHLLRIYIDADEGVGLADCEKVSHQVSGVLDVEDPIRGEYTLEVSSPGLDRPLYELAHFARFVGQVARVKLRTPVEGRRNYKGTILSAEDDVVVLQVDGERVELPVRTMESARLVPEF